MFADRKEAGRRLAEKLVPYRGKYALVLALPRGGVVTGYEVAQELKLPLDIIAVRKVGHPDTPEYVIGTVDEKGAKILNETEIVAIDPLWLAQEVRRQKAEAGRRSLVYRDGREPPPIKGRTIIIVDDGIATGLTMRLAVRSVKSQKPARIIVAVPVAPSDSVRALKEEGADEVVVLEPPEQFLGAVGAPSVRFGQVGDSGGIKL